MFRYLAINLMAWAFFLPSTGCGNSSTPPSAEVTGTGENETEHWPEQPVHFGPEAAEFVGKLDETFDCWSRGETLEQFSKTHPGIQVFEPTWLLGLPAGDRLIQYKVVKARPVLKNLPPAVKRRYELFVTLDIRERTAQITKTNRYLVQEHRDESWLIAIQGNSKESEPTEK